MSRRGTVGVKGSFSTGNADYIDIPILKLLPAEGTMIGQFHPLAKTVRAILEDLGGKDTGLTVDQLNGRLQSMRALGQVVSVNLIPRSTGVGWQITPAGREYLEARS